MQAHRSVGGLKEYSRSPCVYEKSIYSYPCLYWVNIMKAAVGSWENKG
jgi:hypothetical protein